MKQILISAIIVSGLFMSCASTKEVAQEEGMKPINGTVSHKYRSGGCPTVILAVTPESDSLILIPSNSLGTFDTDGMKIAFTYRMLRMPNPEGCSVGNPAEIISIKKR